MKPYSKKLNLSYSLGAFPTIELLKNKPSEVIKVMLHDSILNNQSKGIVEALCIKNNIQIEYNSKFIEKVSPKENCYMVGIFNKYESSLTESNHIVLVNPSNTGNLGTIIRCMLGFDFLNLVIILPSVDIFNPNTIRASMGSIFNINFEFYSTISEYLEKHPNNTPYYLMTNGQMSLDELTPKTPFSMVFGNESTGLEDKYSESANSVFIEQSENIDSLNLAVASSIVMHKLYVHSNK